MAPVSASDAVDIFISYSREDRPCAERLADVFSTSGWRVWWDREIDVGADFGALIEAKLVAAKAVVVLWSEHSIQSGFVKDEAGRARDASKLHPVRIDSVTLPIGFGHLQTFDLLRCRTAEADISPLVDQLGRALAKTSAGPGTSRRRSTVVRILQRNGTRVSAAGLVVVAIVALLARGWWREKQCNEAFARTNTGVEKLQDGNTEQAIDFFTEAIRMCSVQALAFRYRGEAYARLNDYPPAIADLDVALTLGLEEYAKKRVTELLAKIDEAQQKGAIAVASPPVPLPSPPPPTARPGQSSPAATPAPAVDRPPLEPSPPLRSPSAETERAIKNMFAPDKDTRIAATTSLVLDPARAASAVPLALQTANAQFTNESGVINTLVVLQAAGPAALQQQHDDVEQLLTRAERNGPQTKELVAKVRAAFNPIVYIQIGSEAQRALAVHLTRELVANGFEAAGVENVSTKADVPAATPEIRVQGTSGRGAAQIIGGVVQRLTTTPPKILSLARLTPKRDTYELWLDKRTCVDPQRRPPACEK